MSTRGYACVGMDNPKDKNNIGSALRAVGVYGAAMIAVSGKRYQRAVTDTRAQHRNTPLLMFDDILDAIPFDCVPVAIDIIAGARPLPKYEHPERAFYIFGAEDATLGERVTRRCRDIVYVPTDGCMNLAATINVVLYDRMVKRALYDQ